MYDPLKLELTLVSWILILYFRGWYVCFWLIVISEQEFYGSRTSSAHELCARRLSDDDNGDNETVAETYHLSTYAAQNSTPSADHSTHAKLTYKSSLSAPDVQQVTDTLYAMLSPKFLSRNMFSDDTCSCLHHYTYTVSQAAPLHCTVVRPMQKSIEKWEIRPPVKS